MTDLESSPLISVFMATYNAERTAARAAMSVLSQSLSDLELLIFDAHSTDNTPSILRAIANQDSRVRLTLLDRQQPYITSLREALNASRGRYFAIVDGDDFISPNWIQGLLEATRQGDYIAGMGMLTHCDLSGEAVWTHPSSGRTFPFAASSNRRSRLRAMVLTPDTEGAVNLFYSLWLTDVFKMIGVWQEDGERRDDDYLFCLRALSMGAIAQVPSVWICRTIPSAIGEGQTPKIGAAPRTLRTRTVHDWNFPFIVQLFRFIRHDRGNIFLIPPICARVVLAVLALPARFAARFTG
jgi:glycosyltransferase involved in cell wall biosynthesis